MRIKIKSYIQSILNKFKYIIAFYITFFCINLFGVQSNSEITEFKNGLLYLKENSDFIGIVKLKKIAEKVIAESSESVLDIGNYYSINVKNIIKKNKTLDSKKNIILCMYFDIMKKVITERLGDLGELKETTTLLVFFKKISRPPEIKKKYQYYKSNFSCYLDGENSNFTNKYINKLIGEELKLVKDDFILAMKYFILDKDKTIKLTPKAKEIYEKIFEYEKLEKIRLREMVYSEKLSKQDKIKEIKDFLIKKSSSYQYLMNDMKDDDFITIIKYFVADDKSKIKLEGAAKTAYHYILKKDK